MYSSKVLINELSCRNVSDLAWAARGRAPIAAPKAPIPAAFRNRRRDVRSMLSPSCSRDQVDRARPGLVAVLLHDRDVERRVARRSERQAPFEIDPALGQLLGQAPHAELARQPARLANNGLGADL